MTDGRVCACGCGASMEHTRPQARYASDACRSRAWKARTGYRVVRARKARQNGTGKRREGVTVYFPTVSMAATVRDAIEAAGAGIEPFGIIDAAILRREARP